MIKEESNRHFVFAGNIISQKDSILQTALTMHFPSYELNERNRTRITLIVKEMETVHDIVFEYKELLDNSYWRIVDLTGKKPEIELHRPQYEGKRKDFVDLEWEFVLCHFSNLLLQEKLRRWANDSKQKLVITLGYDDDMKNKNYAEKLRNRLSDSVEVIAHKNDPLAESEKKKELMEMAKYLHYFYKVCYEQKHVPTELPENEVNKAWNDIDNETLKKSNLYNVMSIPVKMQILGHDRNDWNTLYALTAEEIEMLTAVEHNRWCVERLIQGMRPCTDDERTEVKEDIIRRLNDPIYREKNPISLKKRYKIERNAHYDLCAFSELDIDESGKHVSRYDRDLTAAIPLIVKTFNDRYYNG